MHLKGGDLVIRRTAETVYMTGEAALVFSGEVGAVSDENSGRNEKKKYGSADKIMTKYIFVTGGVVSGLGKGHHGGFVGQASENARL